MATTRPTYREIDDTHIDVDSPAKTVSIFEKLRDNTDATRVLLVPTNQTAVNTTSTTFVKMGSSIYVPLPTMADYTGIQRNLEAIILGYLDASGTGTVRLRDVASGNTGTEVTVTSVTPAADDITPDLDFLSAWQDTVREIEVQGKVTSGQQLTLSWVNRAGWRLDY